MKRYVDAVLGHSLGALVLACSVFLPQKVLAQDYPTHTVTLVVPTSPGTAADITARIMGQKMSENIGQQVLVENRPGAGTNIGSNYVAKAAPDGYTMLMATSSPMAINVSVYKALPYDPATDLVPLAMVAQSPFILVVNPDLPVKSVKELIAYGKANPGKISYASGGHGSHGHLTGGLFASRAGIDIVHVPYKGGSQSTTDLLAGQVQMYFGNASELLPQAGNDRIRLIAVSSPERMAQLPNTPAVAEFFPGFDMASWNGFLAPRSRRRRPTSPLAPTRASTRWKTSAAITSTRPPAVSASRPSSSAACATS